VSPAFIEFTEDSGVDNLVAVKLFVAAKLYWHLENEDRERPWREREGRCEREVCAIA
jgi:hypothetical protein